MKVVCDALNFLSYFVPGDDAAFHGASECFAEAHARVTEFVNALKAAAVDMVFVFGNGQTTEEANMK